MLTLRERPFRIVGVMPPGFDYPRGSEAWITVAALKSTVTSKDFVSYVDLIARLRPGATIDQARAELGVIDRLGQRLAVGRGGTEDAGDLGVADRLEALGMELGDKAGAHKPDTQGRYCHGVFAHSVAPTSRALSTWAL